MPCFRLGVAFCDSTDLDERKSGELDLDIRRGVFFWAISSDSSGLSPTSAIAERSATFRHRQHPRHQKLFSGGADLHAGLEVDAKHQCWEAVLGHSREIVRYPDT